MSLADLVVAVRERDEEVPGLIAIGEGAQELQRGQVRPLQVVEEEDERVTEPREDAEEAPDHVVEATLGQVRADLRRPRALAEELLQLGDHVEEDLRVEPERVFHARAERGDTRGALEDELPHELPERLHDWLVRDVALELVELARQEIAARERDRAVQLAHQRRLPDAGVAGDQDELAPPAGDALEGAFEQAHVGVAAEEPLGDREPRRGVARAQGERGPALLERAQIVEQAERALVALLRRLREQLPHDAVERQRQAQEELAEGNGELGDVAVDGSIASLARNGGSPLSIS